jgi:hypothetical protein
LSEILFVFSIEAIGNIHQRYCLMATEGCHEWYQSIGLIFLYKCVVHYRKFVYMLIVINLRVIGILLQEKK